MPCSPFNNLCPNQWFSNFIHKHIKYFFRVQILGPHFRPHGFKSVANSYTGGLWTRWRKLSTTCNSHCHLNSVHPILIKISLFTLNYWLLRSFFLLLTDILSFPKFSKFTDWRIHPPALQKTVPNSLPCLSVYLPLFPKHTFLVQYVHTVYLYMIIQMHIFLIYLASDFKCSFFSTGERIGFYLTF